MCVCQSDVCVSVRCVCVSQMCVCQSDVCVSGVCKVSIKCVCSTAWSFMNILEFYEYSHSLCMCALQGGEDP